jgi:hypothetical protein
MNLSDDWTRQQAEDLVLPPQAVTQEARQRRRELEQCLLIAERDEPMRLEWARRFPEDVTTEVAFFAEKATQKRDREARRAKKEAKKKEKEEKAARKKEEKKNGAGPSTITVDSSSSEFEWSSIPVSSTTPNSSDFDWESD